jgi:single-strand DNA-binding protein
MANDINKTILVGRITRDPELKETSGGTKICKISLASNKSYKSHDEKKESVGFFDCVIFGKLAEIMAQYGKKGKQIIVDGSLNYSTWDDAEGKKRSKIEIQVDNFQFTGSKPAGQTEPPSEQPQSDGYDQEIGF